MEKRKDRHDESGDVESVEYEPAKRARWQGNGEFIQNVKFVRVDPTFGQRSAIPGLEGEHIDDDRQDSDLDYEDSKDALSYLKAVRAEAFKVPSLLVASSLQADTTASPSREIYEDGIGDFRGWYKDGAYTAMPMEPASSDSLASPSAGPDPQLACFEAIIRRFKGLRERLSEAPPRHVVEGLDRQHGSCMPITTRDWGTWRWRLGNTEPKAAQLAAMHKATVLCLLRLIIAKYLRGHGKKVPRRIGLWIWSLLAKLPASGELGNEEVAVVRDLGKRAVLVGLGLRGIDSLGLNDRELENTGVEEIVGVEIQGEEAGPEDSHKISTALSSTYDIIRPSSHTDCQEFPSSHSLNNDSGEHSLEAARESLLARLHGSRAEEVHSPLGEQQQQRRRQKTEHQRQQEEEEEEEEKGEEMPHAREDEQEPTCSDADEADDSGKVEDIDDVHITWATIDMILTIAGEMYGQRDLLEFREVWE